MAKKKRGGHQSGKRHQKRANAKMSLQQREERVKKAMQHGHDKEAIVHLKQMLKQERRPEWEAWMLEAHQRQTHRLLQAGKFQESARLFESGHQLCGLSLNCAEYIRCLLQLNQTNKATERYVSAQSSLPKADLFELQVELGALVLAGDRRILKLLPADDPVVIDFDKALAVLENWCANNDIELKQGLKALSFRSPYRDLRVLLSASLSDKGKTGGNGEFFTRITAESPYRHLAMLLNTASLDNQEVLSSLGSLNTEEKRFLTQLKGWSKAEAKLAEKLAELPDDPDYASLFRIADSYKTLDAKAMRSMAKMAAIQGSAHHNRAVNLSRFEKRFGRLSESEMAHAKARVMVFAYTHRLLEDDDYGFTGYGQVERTWIDYLSIVGGPDVGEEEEFCIALVNRYLTHLWTETGNPLNETNVSNLEISLRIDPQDKPTHLLLIDFYLSEKKPKKARMAADYALEIYPADISILLAAIKVAVVGNTFKKAAGYAKQILSVDPINIEARRLLHNAHFSHARKLARTGKWHLVQKELKEAGRWTDQPLSKASVAILEACREQQAKHAEVATELLREAFDLAGSALNTGFIMQFEADSIGYDVASLFSQAEIDWPLAALQHKDELFSLVDTVDHFLNEDNTEQIAVVLSQFNTTLSRAVELIQHEDEFEQLCEFWLHTRQDSLLAAYVDEAESQFEHRPIFTYFRMVNKPWLEPDDYQALEEAMDEVKEQGNQNLAMRFLSLLTELPPPPLRDIDPFREMLGLSEDAYDDDLTHEVADYDDNEILNLIRTADMDEVLINIEASVGIPRDESEQIRALIGDKALREFFIRVFNGGGIEDLQDLMPNDHQPPRRKKKKAKKKSKNTRQLGLFE